VSPKPTTTSYALLGLLSVRPWSAYELAQQMTRSLRYCWQVAPSVVYHEPKRLVAMGYATVTRQRNGQRTRAVYQITPAGREALSQWLATTPADPQIQMESMLRLLFADSGTPDELAATLRALQDWAGRLLGEGARQCADYLATGGPFPARLDLIALFAEFYGQLYALTSDWAQRAGADAARWSTTAGPGLSPYTRARLQAIVDDARRRGLDSQEQAPASLPATPNSNHRRDGAGRSKRHHLQR
jgi:PadR family transcriptional regulator, regulatory protein AphA